MNKAFFSISIFHLYLILALLFLTTNSCIEQISFDTKKSEGQLVVSGQIYDNPGPYTLELGLTSTENTLPKPVSGASVMLFNNHGQKESYLETEPGKYRLPGNIITGKRGDTYHIVIELQNGRSFSSLPETMPLHTGSSEVILEPGTYEEQTIPGTIVETQGVYIYANTQIPQHEKPLFLKWDVESLYLFRETEPSSPIAPPPDMCYVSEPIDPQRISLFSSQSSDVNTIDQQFLGIQQVISYQFYIRHYFSVIVSSMTKRRYEYWQKVDEVINQSGTIFDIPPASIPGNIQNETGELGEAFGYFEAAAVDSSRSFIVRADLPVFIENPCPQGFNQDSHFACGNCLEIENSTLERPPYIH